jgi:hypothetical protein
MAALRSDTIIAHRDNCISLVTFKRQEVSVTLKNAPHGQSLGGPIAEFHSCAVQMTIEPTSLRSHFDHFNGFNEFVTICDFHCSLAFAINSQRLAPLLDPYADRAVLTGKPPVTNPLEFFHALDLLSIAIRH